ncbi:unnamed protein product, partial [Iphiclides podalirius]
MSWTPLINFCDILEAISQVYLFKTFQIICKKWVELAANEVNNRPKRNQHRLVLKDTPRSAKYTYQLTALPTTETPTVLDAHMDNPQYDIYLYSPTSGCRNTYRYGCPWFTFQLPVAVNL